MAIMTAKSTGPVELPGHESARALAMSYTRHIPKKLTELGRIRIGHKAANKSGSGTHPEKLDKFRLTSSNKPLLEYAARHPDIGGEVQEWEDAPGDGRQWELYSASDALDVIIPTFSAVSLSYERWSLAGCEQRCTGEVITHCGRNEALIGQPCICPIDDQERASQAQGGTACARILRLNVILPDLPGTGFWRMDTKGFYATAELLGTLALLREAGAEHVMIEAVLRLEQRTTKKVGNGGGTLHFAVPVLWPKYTFRQIAAAKDAHQALLMTAPIEPTPALLAERAAQAKADLFDNAPTASTPARLHASTPVTPRSVGTAADYVPQIEAVIQAQHGDLEAFWLGAEEVLRKPKEHFSVSELATLLTQARERSRVTVEDSTVAAWRSLNALLERLGWTEQEKQAWSNKQARRFKKTFSALPLETVNGLVTELHSQFPQDASPEPSQSGKGIIITHSGEVDTQELNLTAPDAKNGQSDVEALPAEYANVDPETGEIFNLQASAALDRALDAEEREEREPF